MRGAWGPHTPRTWPPGLPVRGARAPGLTCFPRLDFHVLAEASGAGRSPRSNLEYVLGSGLQAGHSGRGVLRLQGGVDVLFVILSHKRAAVSFC